ncbi:hypothetical protein, partial [Escherichia coli]|uniref:hypothetical protein n=1 Tax=Escherichia coli TaxID=562 RepID=UPI003EDF196D
SAGGLAVGILGALKAAGGLWFGWSGETGNEDQPLMKSGPENGIGEFVVVFVKVLFAEVKRGPRNVTL